MGNSTLRDYIRIIFRQKLTILTTFLFVVMTVHIGLILTTPIYEAQVKMLILAEKSVESPYYKDLIMARTSEITLTQSEIVKAYPVLSRTVKALSLDTLPDDREKVFASDLRRKVINYFASLNKKIRTLGSKSAAAVDAIPPAVRFQKAIEDLKEKIVVEPIVDTNIFVISVEDFDPVLASKIANVISRSYVVFDLEQQLAELASKYGAKHPVISQLKDNIDMLSSNLNGEILSDIDAIGPGSVKIIEQAQIPTEPKGAPRSIVMLIGVLFGLILGLLLAIIGEYSDQTVKDSREIEEDLNLPLLGSITRRCSREAYTNVNYLKRHTCSSYYLLLSDQLYLLAKHKNLHSILITSCEAKENTAKLVLNLGMLLSHKAGKKVLVVDADFRKPHIHKLLKVENSNGFADVLEGKHVPQDVIYEKAPNLHVLRAGKTQLNPVVLLDSPQAKEIVNEWKKAYEIILINCPNLRNFKDPVVLSSYIDGTVIVVGEGQTRRQILRLSFEALKQRGANILGTIFNNRTFPIPKFIYERM